MIDISPTKVLVPLLVLLASQIGLVNQELEDFDIKIMLEREHFLKNEELQSEQRMENDFSDWFSIINTPGNWSRITLFLNYIVLRFLLRRRKVAAVFGQCLTSMQLLEILAFGMDVIGSQWISGGGVLENSVPPTLIMVIEFCSSYSQWLFAIILLPVISYMKWFYKLRPKEVVVEPLSDHVIQILHEINKSDMRRRKRIDCLWDYHRRRAS